MFAKRKFLNVHKWIGLLAALTILLQSITGTMLVYRWELARFLDPGGMVRKSELGDQSIGVVLSSVEKSLPEMDIQRVFYPDTSAATYLLQLVNSDGTVHFASVDPGNGKILRFGTVWRFPVEAALRLHYELASGKLGTSIVLLTGICILAMCITGIGYWWPGRGRRWRNSLAVNWRLKPRLVLRQIHRTVGIILAPVLLVMVTTGLIIGGEILLAESASSPAAQVDGFDYSRLEASIDQAQGVFPKAVIQSINFGGDHTVKVQFHAPERNSRAVHQVLINSAGLGLLSVTPADKSSDLWMALLPFHTGSALGRIGPLVVLLAGLTLIILCSMGLVMWLQKPRAKSAALKQAF